MSTGLPHIPAAWRSYILYSLSKIGPGLVMFAAVPIWTRAFGAEQYGLYSMCWVATLFSSAFFTGWLRQAILRHTGDPDFDMNALPSWVVPICATASVLPVIAIVIVESASHASADRVGLVLSGGIFGFLNSYYAVVQTRSQRHHSVGLFTTAEVVRIGGAVGFSLIGAFVFGLQGSVSILSAYCLGTAASLAILKLGFRKSSTSVRRSYLALSRYWAFGWPMTLWLTVSSMLLYSDRLIIGISLDAKAVGSYGSISDLIVRGMGMVTFPLTMRAHPALMQIWNSGDRVGALKLTRRYTRYVLIVCSGSVVLGALFGSLIIESFLGVEVESPLIVPALLGGAAFWQIGLMSHKPLEMANRTKTMLVLILSVTAFSVVANVMLIPLFGLVAAALVVLAGSAVYVIGTYRLSMPVKYSTSNRWGEVS